MFVSQAPLVMQTLDFTRYSPSPHEVVPSLNVRTSGGKVCSSSRSREQVLSFGNTTPTSPSFILYH